MFAPCGQRGDQLDAAAAGAEDELEDFDELSVELDELLDGELDEELSEDADELDSELLLFALEPVELLPDSRLSVR